MSSEATTIDAAKLPDLLRKRATCVYLAMDELPASDASAHFHAAADEIERLREQRAALLAALKAARDFIGDDGFLVHDCEFKTNPERGECRTCAMWADMNAAINAATGEPH